jgi:GNAT superfamily N-acetyltransferase
VAEAARGSGVGSLLVAAAEAWCRDRGLPEVTLHCYLGNEGAHRLYQRLGYEDEWYRMRKGL